MADKTKIEYLDASYNPMKGCGRSGHQSVGCKNCWAERTAARFSEEGEIFHGLTVNGSWSGEVRLYPHELVKPSAWKRPRRIGVSFMGDMFHDNAKWQDQAAVFGAMLMAPQHQFLLLTKRPRGISNFYDLLGSDLIAPWLEKNFIDTGLSPADLCVEIARRKTAEKVFDYRNLKNKAFPPKNVWAGTSVENQATANKRIRDLLCVPAENRWISVEPLIGPINIDLAMYGEGENRVNGMSAFGCTDGFGYEAGIGFIVVGGESGPRYRPMDLDWARALRDECKMAEVPFFFKQTAGKGPIPDDLMVRELPAALNLTKPKTKARNHEKGSPKKQGELF